MASLSGIALGYATLLASMITGQILAESLGIAARFTVWEPMDYAPGAAGLALVMLAACLGLIEVERAHEVVHRGGAARHGLVLVE